MGAPRLFARRFGLRALLVADGLVVVFGALVLTRGLPAVGDVRRGQRAGRWNAARPGRRGGRSRVHVR